MDLRIFKWSKFDIREKLTTIFFFNSTLGFGLVFETSHHIQLSSKM